MGGFRFKQQDFLKTDFDILRAYDAEAKAIDTYRANILEHAQVKDLSSYEAAEIPEADVLIGGFPCQDFSSCGPQRGLNSSRGQLYKALIRYAVHHQPKIIVGENVPGLEKINNGAALQTIMADLRDAGYTVNYWSLYAPDYGVPQTRTRIFIICVRNDIPGFPEKPEPEYSANHRSIDWAIGDLEAVPGKDVANHHQFFLASKAKRGNGQGDEVSRVGLPAYTVRANAKSRVQFHYSLDRRLTIRECARLQTFPDKFTFPHSATTSLMQIGNAVPPMLAHQVALSIQSFLRPK